MVDNKSILKILYNERILCSVKNPELDELIEKKKTEFIESTKKFIKSKIVLAKVERTIEDFIMDYSEVEEMQKYDCYKTGFLDCLNMREDLIKVQKSNENCIEYTELNKTIDELFEARVEKIARLTEDDKKNLNQIRRKVNFDDYFDNIPEDLKRKIMEYTEAISENQALQSGYFNRKYYKYGASDLLKTYMGLLNYNGKEDVNEYEVSSELQD